MALVGFLTPPAVAGLAAIAGVGVGWQTPLWVSLVAGGLGLWLPDLALSSRATTRRGELRDATAGMLDLTVISLAGGVGVADGCKYEWIEPYRQQARQLVTRAHLQLAEDLLPEDPQRASDLLDQAIGHDRYNEALYRAAMHTRHALGDHDGIRNLLRALTRALADIGTEPADDTIELAGQLRASLEQH
jgi:DNA-binding SARP family transcriptional activator